MAGSDSWSLSSGGGYIAKAKAFERRMTLSAEHSDFAEVLCDKIHTQTRRLTDKLNELYAASGNSAAPNGTNRMLAFQPIVALTHGWPLPHCTGWTVDAVDWLAQAIRAAVATVQARINAMVRRPKSTSSWRLGKRSTLVTLR